MTDKKFDPNSTPENHEPDILRNDYGSTRDPAVVIAEADRTVLLTKDETVVIEKEPQITIAPRNRPRKVYMGMWGTTETAVFGLSMLALLATILLYIFLVVPSNREREQNRAERERLEKEEADAKANYGNITDVETRVAELIRSVDDFEVNYLPVDTTGRTALYQRINGLIAGYGLVNTNGPAYAPLDMPDADEANPSDEERGRAKYRSLFPGVYITMTVEGPYHNIRRFIRDIETGREFVVISSVEIEPTEGEAQRGSASPDGTSTQDQSNSDLRFGGQVLPDRSLPQEEQPTHRRGRTLGENVSLRLEMASYFRRPNYAPAVSPGGTN
jgi:Tfp pilus assembly protein PilO